MKATLFQPAIEGATLKDMRRAIGKPCKSGKDGMTIGEISAIEETEGGYTITIDIDEDIAKALWPNQTGPYKITQQHKR